MNFDLILQNFQRGLWTEPMVRVAVNKGIITEEQYNMIIENRPINFTILLEEIEILNGVLEDAETSMIEGVESIG